MVKVQKWLDDKYPTKKKTTKIDSEKGKLERESLEGELILKDFPNLEIVNLSIGKGITKITIEDCPKIYYINVNDNKISEIKGLEELKELQCLWVSYNMITDPDIILKNENLLIFACVRNPIKDRKINGKALNKLIYFSGGIGEEDRIYYSNEKDYVSKLKALANKLGIEDEKLEDKSASEVEESVNDKADTVKDENAKNKTIVDKIKNELPGLISEDKINETKLAELKNLQELVKLAIGKSELMITKIEISPK